MLSSGDHRTLCACSIQEAPCVEVIALEFDRGGVQLCTDEVEVPGHAATEPVDGRVVAPLRPSSAGASCVNLIQAGVGADQGDSPDDQVVAVDALAAHAHGGVDEALDYPTGPH